MKKAIELLNSYGFTFIEYNQIGKNKYMVIVCPVGHITDKKTYAAFKKNPYCTICTELEKVNRYSHVNFDETYENYKKYNISLRKLASSLNIPYSRLREEFNKRDFKTKSSKEVFDFTSKLYMPQHIFNENGVLWSTIPFAPDYKINEHGQVTGKRKEFLSQYSDKDGYLLTVLQTKYKKRITARVHRLMGICFLVNRENKPVINHKNGIKDDNRLENLEWATESENTLHAFDNHLNVVLLGCNSKLSEEDVKNIYINKFKKTAKKLSEQYKVSTSTVHNIWGKRTWKWFTDIIDDEI